MKLYSSIYTLRKSRGILKSLNTWYKRHRSKLPKPQLEIFESKMSQLDEAIIQKDRAKADSFAKELESFGQDHCKKSILDYSSELAIALIFAFIVAVFVRQMWFELYEIPTGSMRPTFKEQDHLTVTKTAFGINFPLETKHLYFDPNLVQRTSIVIFSADGLPLEDTEATYFGILPYTKRYIKRMIGRPGDSIYFYGGELYGVDSQGRELEELRTAPWMESLEYIPFLNFEGNLVSGGSNRIFFQQMHQKVGRLVVLGRDMTSGDVFDGKNWVKDNPIAQRTPHKKIETYSDFWGMRNYAMVRLLNKEQLQKTPGIDLEGLGEGVLYLQLHHTPSLTYPSPTIESEGNGVSIWVTPQSTIIPLQQKHLDAIMDHMYTARFVVKDGKARRYSIESTKFPIGSPSFPNVSDGTYEFYFGKLSRIDWGGITFEVPKDSPLYSRDPANIQKLFNLGMEMNLAYNSYPENQNVFPHRYAYFRGGNLYMMGSQILEKSDPVLQEFHEREKKRVEESTKERPYIAFKDYGPPLKDGKIDVEFIRTFGITVPEGNYLVLGDNHAMSSDSRVFGFVPKANLQGAPCYIIWPPGSRWGAPPQKAYPVFNTPRSIVWGIVALILIVWYSIHLRNMRRPLFKKLS